MTQAVGICGSCRKRENRPVARSSLTSPTRVPSHRLPSRSSRMDVILLLLMVAGIPARRVVAEERSARRVQAVEPAAGTHPQCAVAILVNTGDSVIAEAPLVGRIMPVMPEGVLSRVQAVEPCMVAPADPENAIPIRVNNSDPVIAQAIGIIRIVPVRLQAVSIVTIQSGRSVPNQRKPYLSCVMLVIPALKGFPCMES